MLKHSNLALFSPHCKWALNVPLCMNEVLILDVYCLKKITEKIYWWSNAFYELTICNSLVARLHCGKNRAKLVHFKEQKKYFVTLKHSNLARFSPHCKWALNVPPCMDEVLILDVYCLKKITEKIYWWSNAYR